MYAHTLVSSLLSSIDPSRRSRRTSRPSGAGCRRATRRRARPRRGTRRRRAPWRSRHGSTDRSARRGTRGSCRCRAAARRGARRSRWSSSAERTPSRSGTRHQADVDRVLVAVEDDALAEGPGDGTRSATLVEVGCFMMSHSRNSRYLTTSRVVVVARADGALQPPVRRVQCVGAVMSVQVETGGAQLGRQLGRAVDAHVAALALRGVVLVGEHPVDLLGEPRRHGPGEVPPGLRTRTISLIAATSSWMCSSTSEVMTTSKEPSANGRRVASPRSTPLNRRSSISPASTIAPSVARVWTTSSAA